ncbi:hypothetical protein GIB67_043085 [Kingdonia uniflora]|uniref:Cytochrome b561 domain-containing protein n=1 Tax=Kingdonia uniflora TaxID=39325 RepID=A0A7J7NEM7_9MAGN|nr:hypothetical protein GIB67_043085 [Kingdonia uniflora]
MVVNHLWQGGPLRGNTLGIHRMSGPNVQSMGIVDFILGKVATMTSGGGSRAKHRMVHGVVNAVSWGIMLPLGTIIARHMKVVRPKALWFYLHIVCQCLGYVIGVIGWASGMKLDSDSSGAQHNPHRNIGIVLFSLGTLQVLVLGLRPKPDHKYRIYLNIYHTLCGYTVIVPFLEGENGQNLFRRVRVDPVAKVRVEVGQGLEFSNIVAEKESMGGGFIFLSILWEKSIPIIISMP